MYRAITLKILGLKIDPSNEAAVVSAASNSDIEIINDAGIIRVILDGKDVTEEIRSEEVTRNVSLVSSYADLRKIMVEKQRETNSEEGRVVDGRDIGTVVFPEADLKFFMSADIMERARRRQIELSANGEEMPIVQVVRELKERDLKDSTRQASPLKKADDAIEIDTTNLTIDEQVNKILEYVNEALVVAEGIERK